jgi:hypothetical protein
LLYSPKKICCYYKQEKVIYVNLTTWVYLPHHPSYISKKNSMLFARKMYCISPNFLRIMQFVGSFGVWIRNQDGYDCADGMRQQQL